MERKKALIGLGVILAGALFIKSCGEPYGEAKEATLEFMEEIQEGEGKDAIRYLHPSYRDALAKDLKLPVQFTELKPSEVLSCLLSSMGQNIEDVDVVSAKSLGEYAAEVVLKVEDENELEKIFRFIVIKDSEGDWKIANIESFNPVMTGR